MHISTIPMPVEPYPIPFRTLFHEMTEDDRSSGRLLRTLTSGCEHRHILIEEGDTLIERLRGIGLSVSEAVSSAQTISAQSPGTLQHLHAGDSIDACVRPGDAVSGKGSSLIFLRLSHARGSRSIWVDIADEATGSGEQKSNVSQLRFTLTKNLGDDLRAHGVADSTVNALEKFAYFDRALPAQLPAGTPVTLSHTDESTMQTQEIQIAYRGRTFRIFRYRDSHGRDLVVNRHGRGVLRLTLQRPVHSRRITSGWGWRMHPVLHRREFHKGVDYGAATGTPVEASASGTVTLAGWHGNYGRLVQIDHVGGVATRYGHLSALARGIHAGSVVKKGEVVGYVGESGLATGPHLYFELYERGRRINPTHRRALDVPVRLSGSERRRFQAFVHALDERTQTPVSPALVLMARRHARASS
jgi:murein DD-endopeptidase MepM/ murein hydrolase activator NlpD